MKILLALIISIFVSLFSMERAGSEKEEMPFLSYTGYNVYGPKKITDFEEMQTSITLNFKDNRYLANSLSYPMCKQIINSFAKQKDVLTLHLVIEKSFSEVFDLFKIVNNFKKLNYLNLRIYPNSGFTDEHLLCLTKNLNRESLKGLNFFIGSDQLNEHNSAKVIVPLCNIKRLTLHRLIFIANTWKIPRLFFLDKNPNERSNNHLSSEITYASLLSGNAIGVLKDYF